MADWQAIKTEYITTDTSYRKLAEKYGMDQCTVARRAKKEDWVGLRQQNANDTQAEILKNIGKKKANRAARILNVADKLLGKIEEMADRPEPLNEKAIRALTAAVKDLKEIQGIKSELDKQEQKARIANLQRQVDKGVESRDITVEMSKEMEEYSG